MNKIIIGSLIVGLIVTILGFVLGWAVLPGVVDTEIGKNVELIEGTEQFKRFETLPITFDFKVYFFNLTNRDEANNGTKPIMEEIGPFIYSQTRHKTNITSDTKNNQISYFDNYEFIYDQSKSKELKDTDKITIINPALNGVIQIVDLMLKPLLPNLVESIEVVFENQTDIYIETTVKDFLFDGITICDQTKIDAMVDSDDPLVFDKAIKAVVVCLGLSVMPAKNIVSGPEQNELIFSFLNHKNITDDGHYTVNDGVADRAKLASISKWEDKEKLDYWTNDGSCNTVRGQDATIFPPFINKNSILTIFNTDICRTVDLHYNQNVKIRDVTAQEFVLPENTLSAPNESLSNFCYCLQSTPGINQDNGCVKKGVMELFSCYNAPILLSFPHFLYAADEYKNSVEGVHPEIEKHRTYAHLEPKTGTPLAGAKRIQFNMYARKIENVAFLENYTTPRLVPIIWIEEYVEITDDLYNILYDSYIEKTIIIDGVTYGLIALGVVVMVACVGISIYKNRKGKQTV